MIFEYMIADNEITKIIFKNSSALSAAEDGCLKYQEPRGHLPPIVGIRGNFLLIKRA